MPAPMMMRLSGSVVIISHVSVVSSSLCVGVVLPTRPVRTGCLVVRMCCRVVRLMCGVQTIYFGSYVVVVVELMRSSEGMGSSEGIGDVGDRTGIK